MRKVFVAIPAYTGDVRVETVRSLMLEQLAGAEAGVLYVPAFLQGCSLITQARNQLCADFLDSDCDRMVFIDADVAWEPGALTRLVGHDVDLVGGAYRYKNPEEKYPVGFIQERAELWADPTTGLLEVDLLPGGFLSISRAALEMMAGRVPAYEYQGRMFHGYFAAPILATLWGEDSWFCRSYREAGGHVWLDPELTLTHVTGGGEAYTGRIGDWLRGRECQPAAST